jgi:hypothetical protein
MDDSYLAMAREAASLCSSIQDQLAELAAMEAAGATEVATITPARGGTTSARASRATKMVTLVRPSSDVEAEGDYEDVGTVTDDDDCTLDGSNVKLMLEKSVKPSTRENYSRL